MAKLPKKNGILNQNLNRPHTPHNKNNKKHQNKQTNDNKQKLQNKTLKDKFGHI